MKTLYLDCGMGAAGDMLTAALLELLPDPDGFLTRLNGLGIPGVTFVRETSVKCGITGTHVSVLVDGEEEGHHEHHEHHDHHHEHHHEHHHSGMEDIRHLVTGHLKLPEEVAGDVLAVYDLIAAAESRVHGVPVTEIHFHEVGTLDAVADITAVCLLMREIAPDEVVVSPVHVGSGQVTCAHGILPVPAPATAHILQGVPSYGGEIRGELCTPTGAALLKHFAARFGAMPVMAVQKIGYGMGKKDFPAANCVRAMLGDSETDADAVVEFFCNVDDMTGEEIGFALERLQDGGALDAYTVPIGMKKSRPGTQICVMCRPQDRDRVLSLLFKHTSTIGVREALTRRVVLARETENIETAAGTIRVKRAAGCGVNRKKIEFEDLARIARERDLSLAEARALIETDKA